MHAAGICELTPQSWTITQKLKIIVLLVLFVIITVVVVSILLLSLLLPLLNNECIVGTPDRLG